MWQGARNGEAQHKAEIASTKLSSTLDGISLATQETTRIQALNTQLQERLLEQSGTIATLAKDAIKTTTGGESYCYMSFFDYMTPECFPVVYAVGAYPLYDLSARIVDIDKYNSLPQATGVQSIESARLSERTVNIGSIKCGFGLDG